MVKKMPLIQFECVKTKRAARGQCLSISYNDNIIQL